MIVGYVLLERPHLLREMAEILFLQHLLLNTLSIVVIISHHHFALSLLSLCSNKIFFKQIRTTTGACMLLCAVMTNTCMYYTTYACHYQLTTTTSSSFSFFSCYYPADINADINALLLLLLHSNNATPQLWEIDGRFQPFRKE